MIRKDLQRRVLSKSNASSLIRKFENPGESAFRRSRLCRHAADMQQTYALATCHVEVGCFYANNASFQQEKISRSVGTDYAAACCFVAERSVSRPPGRPARNRTPLNKHVALYMTAVKQLRAQHNIYMSHFLTNMITFEKKHFINLINSSQTSKVTIQTLS